MYSDSPKPADIKIFNLNFSNAKRTASGIFDLTGSLNVYNANFESSGLKITNSYAEDSLNIVKSKVLISDLTVLNSVSDAFDCDYCIGSISGIRFERIGGDGLDFSGSNVTVKNTAFYSIKDKAVSLGEKSDATIEIDKVDNTYTAVAVKDGSNATIKLGEVSTIGPMVMSYRKKFIYDAISIARVLTSKPNQANDSNYISSFGTRIFVNGKQMATQYLNVDDLYDRGAMKK